MTEPWATEIDRLRTRLGGLIERTGLDDVARELASETIEEFAVIVEEMQTQNSELIASRGQLEQERQRFRDLFESVPDGYVVTDASGVVREANATACDLLGQPRRRLVGRPLSVRIGADDQRSFYAHLNRIRHDTSGGLLSVDLTVRNQELVPVNLRATIDVEPDDGDVEIRWLIHDRRREFATDELRESEKRLRSLFNSAGVGIVLCDTGGDIVFVNQYAEHLLGRDLDNTSFAASLEVTEYDDRMRLDEIIADALDRGVAGFLRHRLAVELDDLRWVDHSVTPFRDELGAVSGFVSILTDVSAEQNAANRLAQSRDFAAAILDTVGALVVVLDPSGRVQRFNPACEKVTGLTAADVVGRDIFETLVPPEEHDAVRQVFADLLTQRANTFENSWLTADGSTRHIAWSNSTLAEDDGTIASIIATGIDVSDRRLLEQQLGQADRLDSIGRLAAGIGHDFNNVLAVLQLRLDRLEARVGDGQSRTDLDAMSDVIHRSQTLIADLLSFGRRQKLDPTPMDISGEVRRVMTMLTELLGDDIDLQFDLTEDDAVALIDAGRFHQILMNLAINARDAMPDGGTMTLATTVEQIGTGQSIRSRSGLDPGSYVRLTVADTGSGIDPAVLPHVFEPYFTTKQPGRGTGLGLATTYGTVIQSGGKITVSSEIGIGSTFTIWLPCASPAPFSDVIDGRAEDRTARSTC